jgi:hypothetical protein
MKTLLKGMSIFKYKKLLIIGIGIILSVLFLQRYFFYNNTAKNDVHSKQNVRSNKT